MIHDSFMNDSLQKAAQCWIVHKTLKQDHTVLFSWILYQAWSWRWQGVNLLKKKRSSPEHLLKLNHFWMSWAICTIEKHHTAAMIGNNKLINFDWSWRYCALYASVRTSDSPVIKHDWRGLRSYCYSFSQKSKFYNYCSYCFTVFDKKILVVASVLFLWRYESVRCTGKTDDWLIGFEPVPFSVLDRPVFLFTRTSTGPFFGPAPVHFLKQRRLLTVITNSKYK